MMRRYHEGVRCTHLPTGITAQSCNCAPRGRKWAFYHEAARKLLLARLCRPEPEQPPTKRTYDLAPYLGLPANIRQDGRWLVVGRDEVEMVFRGGLDRVWAQR